MNRPGDYRYTRSEVPGVSDTVKEAFAANEAFQKAEAAGRHIRTKIVTLKNGLEAGQAVQPAPSALRPSAL